MAFMAPLLVGSAATGTAAATAGLIGAGGSLTAGGVMSGLGTVLSLGGALGSASAMKASAKAESEQLKIKAGQEEAASQKRAALARDKANIMMSRALAVGAASGAGTSGIEGIMADIAGRGEENAQGEIYEGSELANSLRYKGEVGKAQAKQQAKATVIGALGGAATSIAGRFAPSAAPTAMPSAALDYGYSEGSGTGFTTRIWG